MILITILAVSLWSLAASAQASRSMTGTFHVENPSSNLELPPGVYGKKVGGALPNTLPPTDGTRMIAVTGATSTTSTGRQITVASGQLDRTGFDFATFPPFANVGQVSKSFMTTQMQATFANGAGALAACPGNGCTASGAGTAISWCPPVAPTTMMMGTGTTATTIGSTATPNGEWDCGFWLDAALAGERGLRISISNAAGAGAPHFGGTLDILRNQLLNVWRVPVQPSTPNASDAEVTRSFMDFADPTNLPKPWPGGDENFHYVQATGNNGPRILASINANGAIAGTHGCVNGVGTVGGGGYVPQVVNPVLGSNCGTDPVQGSPGQDWGFKMTTGTISGSDPYPFGPVVTTALSPGTIFNPNFGTQAASLGFFWSRQGGDSASGTNRNIVLLGGGVSVDPGSGNSFFRTTRLEMNMTIPEPATSLGLLAGAGVLIGLARRRGSRA